MPYITKEILKEAIIKSKDIKNLDSKDDYILEIDKLGENKIDILNELDKNKKEKVYRINNSIKYKGFNDIRNKVISSYEQAIKNNVVDYLALMFSMNNDDNGILSYQKDDVIEAIIEKIGSTQEFSDEIESVYNSYRLGELNPDNYIEDKIVYELDDEEDLTIAPIGYYDDPLKLKTIDETIEEKNEIKKRILFERKKNPEDVFEDFEFDDDELDEITDEEIIEYQNNLNEKENSDGDLSEETKKEIDDVIDDIISETENLINSEIEEENEELEDELSKETKDEIDDVIDDIISETEKIIENDNKEEISIDDSMSLNENDSIKEIRIEEDNDKSTIIDERKEDIVINSSNNEDIKLDESIVIENSDINDEEKDFTETKNYRGYEYQTNEAFERLYNMAKNIESLKEDDLIDINEEAKTEAINEAFKRIDRFNDLKEGFNNQKDYKHFYQYADNITNHDCDKIHRSFKEKEEGKSGLLAIYSATREMKEKRTFLDVIFHPIVTYYSNKLMKECRDVLKNNCNVTDKELDNTYNMLTKKETINEFYHQRNEDLQKVAFKIADMKHDIGNRHQISPDKLKHDLATGKIYEESKQVNSNKEKDSPNKEK